MPLGFGLSLNPRRSGASWTPLTLFLAGEQGGWYDPSDLSTMFQDSAGTTPVTAVEQPAGLWLDKRLGALSALGPDQVTNGDNEAAVYAITGQSFQNATLARAASPSGPGFAGQLASSTSASASHQHNSGLIMLAGRTYRITGRVYVPTGGVANFRLFDNGDGSWFGLNVTAKDAWVPFSVLRLPKASTWQLGIGNNDNEVIASGTAAFWVDNLSIREVPGNHLIQPTAPNRPVYSKRYNQALSTDDLTTASWTASGLLSRTVTGSATLPTGAVVPLTRCVENTANAAHRVQNTGNYTLTSGQEYVVSAVVKKGSRTWHYLRFDDASSSFLWFNADTGATGTVSAGLTSPSVVSLGDGAWLVSARRVTNAAAVQVLIGYGTADNSATFLGDGASFFDAGGVDLRRTIHTQMGMPAYQRVTTATDYDQSGFLPRLAFNGASSGMYSAASVDFSASDEMTVLAGLTKLSDATRGMIVELGPDTTASFAMQGPHNNLATTWAFYSRGSGGQALVAPSPYPAPETAVIRGLAKISAPSSAIARNGVQLAITAASQGTGNYGNHALYIGRRNNASLPYNGDIFQLIVRGALTSGADLTSAEQYVAQRTGVTL